jgi:phenylacetic acid degradation operon negative regulatory protein
MAPTFESAAERVVSAFQRQRPVRSGSLIITLFGDALAPRGGEISLASLIALLAGFGVSERLVRTAVGRLAQEGWIQAERLGRLSYYGLTAAGRERFAQATRRIYGSTNPDWHGRWTLVLAGGVGRSRQRLRRELEWLGFGALANGVFAHPEMDAAAIRRELEEPSLLDSALVLSGHTADAASARRLVNLGWDLADLERRYRRFLQLFTPVLTAASKRGTRPGAACLVVRTLLVHEYRRVHLRDPLLPRSLLPADWAGAAAYDLCRSLYGLVYQRADAYLSERATTRQGPLPSASPELQRRFGGL